MVVSLLQHLKDLGDLEVTMAIKDGRVVMPLNVVRPYGRAMPPKGP
jgi:hypothetical protein